MKRPETVRLRVIYEIESDLSPEVYERALRSWMHGGGWKRLRVERVEGWRERAKRQYAALKRVGKGKRGKR